jgi:glycosyltransferase involved in cell wall biosynthesis
MQVMEFEASEANDLPISKNTSDQLTKPRRLSNFMHTFVTRLETSSRRRMLKRFLFPFARKMNSFLKAWDKKSIQDRMIDKESPNRIFNLFVLDQTWTLMDISNNDGTLEIYQALVEWEIIAFQVILYDFTPLFHAWTAGAGTPLLYNKYLRLVMLANRVLAISDLVAEQAELVTKAFRLERKSWISRPSSIRGLNLPSGVKGIFAGEFPKKSNTIVVLGSVEPRKNLWQVFDALEILHRQQVRTETILIGNAGWKNDQILERLNALQNLGVHCSRRNRTGDSELREIVGSASVVLFVSEAEGFGLPIAEALSLGTRVIVSDIRPLNEWRDNWVTCVPIGSPKALAEEILRHLENPIKNSRPPISEITWQDWDTALFG